MNFRAVRGKSQSTSSISQASIIKLPPIELSSIIGNTGEGILVLKETHNYEKSIYFDRVNIDLRYLGFRPKAENSTGWRPAHSQCEVEQTSEFKHQYRHVDA